ncbi:hypothetical protein DFH28DRAFT_855476, partial [Melampsora americana]
DKSQRPLSYNSFWCKKRARISLTSDSNLEVHRNGSSQPGCSGHGCANRTLTINTGHKLPLSISQQRAQKKSTKK